MEKKRSAYVSEIGSDFAALDSAWASNVGPISALNDLGGDAHRGRYPIEIIFDAQRSLIYKPRPAVYEALLFEILDLIAADTEIVWPRVTTITAEYGSWWMPIRAATELDPIAVQRFYFASGVLLAAAFVVGLSDLNHENVLVYDGLPCVIDAEFLCQPSMVPFHGRLGAERRAFEMTVLSTLMLPLPGRHSDPSALGSARGSMAANGKWSPSFHRPQGAHGRLYLPADYTLEICNGFLAGMSALSRRIGVIADLLRTRLSLVRVALRPTAFYASLEAMLWSEALASASTSRRRAFLFDKLSNACWKVEGYTATQIREYEAWALLEGDIPLFYASVNDTELRSGERAILGKVFLDSPLMCRMEHLSSIANNNGFDQVACIQYAMREMLSAESSSAEESGTPSYAPPIM